MSDAAVALREGEQALAYDRRFFDRTAEGSWQSANVVAPIVAGLVPVRTVIDVGCGVGLWLRAFREHGAESVLGIDGPYVDRAMLQVAPESFIAADLTDPPPLHRHDAVLCLEVAEHLEAEHADAFVAYLGSLSDVVVFSAAIPGQGGENHVNEQWPSYWCRKFNALGFVAYDVIRPAIWNNPGVECWYRQNIVLYCRKGLRIEGASSVDDPAALDRVHPMLWDAFRSGNRLQSIFDSTETLPCRSAAASMTDDSVQSRAPAQAQAPLGGRQGALMMTRGAREVARSVLRRLGVG